MRYHRRHFVYAIVFPVFGAGGQQQLNFTVDNDADFMVVSITFTERVAAPALLNYTVLIRDTKTSQDWSNVPLPIQTCLDGTGQLPYTLSAGRMLPRRTTVTGQLNAAAASVGGALDLTLAFHGYRMYPAKRQG